MYFDFDFAIKIYIYTQIYTIILYKLFKWSIKEMTVYIKCSNCKNRIIEKSNEIPADTESILKKHDWIYDSDRGGFLCSECK